MSGVRELSPIWVKKLRTGIQNRRRDNAKMAALCKPGGEYRNQLEMVVSAADAMLAADDMLAALRHAVLALAFAAETWPAMQDDYVAVSAAIKKATGA